MDSQLGFLGDLRHDWPGDGARLSWLSSHFGAGQSGRATTAINLVLFLFAFGAQYAIGAIIDLFPTDATGGYDPRGYQVGFGAFLAAQLLALVWYLLGRRSLIAAAQTASPVTTAPAASPDIRPD